MTLVEVVITIALFTMILGAVSLFGMNVFSYRRSVSGSYEIVQNSQLILKTMASELREMAPAITGAYPLAVAGSSTVTFFSDVDNNGVPEQIRYFVSNKELYRGVVKASGSPISYNQSNEVVSGMLDYVTNASSSPIFEYFNENYSGTSSPMVQPVQTSSVRLIRINLNLTSPDSISSNSYTTEVTLRNLKDNL